MYNFITKFVALVIVLGLNMPGVLAAQNAFAHFGDIENSTGSTFGAGTLDFRLESLTTNFVPFATVTNMEQGDSVTREISVIKEIDSNPFQYNARTVKTGGNDGFCNALELKAELDGVVKYPYDADESLLGFNLEVPVEFSDLDQWVFTVTLPMGTSFDPGKYCRIEFVFDGWQTQYDYAVPLSGFNDTEKIPSSFATGGMKIDKVYYDVDSAHGSDIANEWIEIYNPLDNIVDISGWKICDNTDCDIIPSSDPIPGRGFAIITGNNSTWDYWDIPDDVVKIVLGDLGDAMIGGDGLDNDGDRVILKMADGTEDDAMCYGTDTYAFNPSCPDVPTGHALGRDPNGYDHNQASDFIEFSFPEIKDIRVYQYGRLVVDMNNSYRGVLWGNEPATIKWTAENPTGPHSDLSVDILYIQDDYPYPWGNNAIDAFDSVSNVNVDPIPNPSSGEGSYDWSSVIHFLGDVWFKIVATNTKNFMFSSSAVSHSVFEPLRGDSMEDILALLAARGMSASELADIEAKLSASFAEDIEAPDVTAGEFEDNDKLPVVDLVVDEELGEEIVEDNDIFSALVNIGGDIIDAVTGGGSADADADANTDVGDEACDGEEAVVDALEQSEVKPPTVEQSENEVLTNDDENDSEDEEVLDTLIINNNTFVATSAVDTESIVDEIENGDTGDTEEPQDVILSETQWSEESINPDVPEDGSDQLAPADSHSEPTGEESLGLSQNPPASAGDSSGSSPQNDEDGAFDETEAPADAEAPVGMEGNDLADEVPTESEPVETPADILVGEPLANEPVENTVGEAPVERLPMDEPESEFSEVGLPKIDPEPVEPVPEPESAPEPVEPTVGDE